MVGTMQHSTISPMNGDSKKLRRITRACDYCHKRSIRCKFPSEGDSSRCQNCVDFDQPCRFERVVKRRGAKPRSQNTFPTAETPTPAVVTKHEPSVHVEVCRTPSIADSSPTIAWEAPQVASQAVVMDLVEIYFEVVYPLFPIFHRPTFIRKVARGEYMDNKYSFGATMAMCALVSARITDHAVFNPHWDTRYLTQIKSEVFYAAAVKECGNVGALNVASLDLLRTCALLAVTAIQYGRVREMQTHLGKYHCLVAMDGLHDEGNWPDGIGIVETEERRRLFWSMYNLDIFTSIMWNGMIRGREQEANVSYTTELDDELFDDSGYRPVDALSLESPIVIGPSPTHGPTDVRSSSWLCGWNFATDLYRILEHVVTHFRDKRKHKRSFLHDMFGEHFGVSASNVRDSIMAMYNNLPQCFKETQAITCDANRDRYGFQAANITAAVQLLRMVLFSSAGATIDDRCKIASEVVDAYMRTPVQYLQAISSPLIYHLTGIGSILGSVFEEALSESDYLQVRVVLLALAQLLENLDHGLHYTSSADKLRNIVARVDTQMENKRRGVNIEAFERARESNKAHLIATHGATSSPYVLRRASLIDSSSEMNTSISRGSGSGSGSGSSRTGSVRPPGTNDIAVAAPEPASFAVSGDFLNGWPWSFDLMQFPES